MPDEVVLLDVQEQVATVTLNRPERMNAWTEQLGEALSAEAALDCRPIDLVALEGTLALDNDNNLVPLSGKGKEVLDESPHVSMIPAAIMFMTVVSFNLIGDSLRSYFERGKRQL